MKKIFAVFLAVMTLAAFFKVAPAAASSGEYAFINDEKGTTGKADVTFNVSKGKSAISLTLNKKEVVQGEVQDYLKSLPRAANRRRPPPPPPYGGE